VEERLNNKLVYKRFGQPAEKMPLLYGVQASVNAAKVLLDEIALQASNHLVFLFSSQTSDVFGTPALGEVPQLIEECVKFPWKICWVDNIPREKVAFQEILVSDGIS
jgi:hypothetical protein